MKFIIMLAILLFCNEVTQAQNLSAFSKDTNLIKSSAFSKPIIDINAIKSWSDLSSSTPNISNDGHYFFYCIRNQPVGSYSLVIQATMGLWEKKILNINNGYFTEDNKSFIYYRNDTLFFLPLGKNQLLYKTNIKTFKISKEGCKFLAYQVKDSSNLVVLWNLYTGQEKRFFLGNKLIYEYAFNNNGSVLLLKTKKEKNNPTSDGLWWIDVKKDKLKLIWSQEKMDNNRLTLGGSCFDAADNQLIFLVQERLGTGSEKDEQHNQSIWYYKAGMEKAVMKINDYSTGICPRMQISNSIPYFSTNGRYIFFALHPKPETRKPNSNAVQVDIWNYNDKILQYTQLLQQNGQVTLYDPKINFTAVVSTTGGMISCLEEEDIKIAPVSNGDGEYLVIGHEKYIGDKTWLLEPTSYFLVALKDGTRKKLITSRCINFTFSPSKEYLIWYDLNEKNYFSYSFISSKIQNLSKAIPSSIINENLDDVAKVNYFSLGIGGWLKNSQLLIYDNYDIWQVDPSGTQNPINITNGFGSLHQIKFRIVHQKDEGGDFIYSREKPILLSAFNVQNKNNGFYSIMPGKKENPKLLTMGPFCFYMTAPSQTPYGVSGGMLPVKAKNANVWIVKRQRANEAPNFYFTRDFLSFKELTNCSPQKNWNWLTSELVNWTQLNGKTGCGILYKPENFTPYKKYPVIIYYYEKVSQGLNLYCNPEFTGSELNVPWFVSRGYLVFTPDIHYTIGQTAQSVLNSVVSATKYLKQLPWVDSSKIGLQGHSFGGYETNILITNTQNMYAAAAEGAGPTDFISLFGSMRPGLVPQAMSLFENDGQCRTGGSLWEVPEAYIENSPLFKAKNVTTPLLIVHNKNDITVPWQQAVEFFLALRRLDKKVWMLQYDDGSHGVTTEKDKIDLTIRLTQYFDYYLKGALPPKWMTEGIPARMKGIETGYELDSTECYRQ